MQTTASTMVDIVPWTAFPQSCRADTRAVRYYSTAAGALLLQLSRT